MTTLGGTSSVYSVSGIAVFHGAARPPTLEHLLHVARSTLRYKVQYSTVQHGTTAPLTPPPLSILFFSTLQNNPRAFLLNLRDGQSFMLITH